MNDQVTDDVSCILLTNDQAESSAKLFNFDAYSDAFAEIIKSTRTPFVIGIFGDWGCGKTSLMKTLEKKINKKLFIDDIEKPDSLANKLLDPKNPLSVNLLKRSPKLKKLLDENESKFDDFESLKSDLVSELNLLLDKRESSSDKQAFEQLDDLSIAKIVNKLQDPKNQLSSQFIDESQKLKDLLDEYLLLESFHNKFIGELNNLLDNPRLYNEEDKKTFENLYLFSWDNTPGNDSERFLRILKENFGVDWMDNAGISKSDDGKTINIKKGENSAEMVIDEKAGKATLKLSDGEPHDLKVKSENGKQNIYKISSDKTLKYLFDWDSIPENDSEKLRSILKKNFGVDWAQNADISKSDDGKTIHIEKGEKKAEIVIDEMAEYATLDLSNGRIHYLKVKTENGETKITVKPTKKPQTKEDIFLFNRFLLENAYPGEIAQIQKADDITVKTIWFNAWKYDKEDELWRTLLMRVLDELKIQENPKRVESNWFMRRRRKLNSYFRSPRFYSYDLDNFGNVAVKIKDETNPLSQYILNKFNTDSKKLMDLYDGSPPLKKELESFVEELNKLLEDKNLFDEQRFLEVHLTDETKRLIYQKPQTDKDLKRLNRKLLQEAYWEENLNEKIEDLQTTLYQEVSREEPGNLEFKPGKLFGGTVKLGISGQNPQVLPDALKELSESIQKTKRIEHIQKIQFKEQFQYRFEEIIKTYYINRNKKVVIFIDDLDRCLPEKALEIIESIKTFMDIEGCIFVIGIDKDVISYIIRQKYKENIEKQEDEKDRSEKIQINGENYLEKIIQLSFQLPPIKHDDLKILFTNLTFKDKKFYEPYLRIIIEGIEPNPRKLKRFFNLIEFQRRLAKAIMPEKDSLYDCVMIIWTIISSTHPELSKAIIRDNSLFRDIFFKEILEDEISKGTPEYLFSWDSIPENDSEKLRSILKENFGVDWAQNADIKKTNGGKSIYIYKDENSAEIVIDENTGKATLKLSNDETHDLKVESENDKIKIYTDEKKSEYLFSWDSVPEENDSEKLRSILKDNFGVDWAQYAGISKSDDGKTINIKKGENSAEMVIDENTGKATLKLSNDETHDLKVESENDKIKIYTDEKKSEYLFSWDSVPEENDSEKLRSILKENFGVDWAQNVDVSRSADGKTINIKKGENSAEMVIDEKAGKATLKLSDGRTHDLKVESENDKIKIYTDEEKSEYLFSWDSVPENGSERFLRILKENFGVDWMDNAGISKSDDSKTINIKKGENSALIEIDEKAGKATLKLSDEETHDLKVKSENGKQNIYKISGERDEDLPDIKKLSEDKRKLIDNVVAHVHEWVNEYSFSWDSVPGNDSEKLRRILKEYFGVDWAENAGVTKSADGKTIHVDRDENSALIEIDKKAGKATLKLSDGRTHDLKVESENDKIKIYTDEEKSEYLFRWDSVPENDSEKLRSILTDNFGVDWAQNAGISKSADGKTINIKKGENSAEMVIDEKAGKTTLKLSDGRTHDLKVEIENGKQNILLDIKETKLKNIIDQVISLGHGEAEMKLRKKEFEDKKDEIVGTGQLEISVIEQAIKNKQSLKGKDLTILSDEDEAKKLKILNFSYMDLEDANLEGAYLQGAKFVRSKLDGAILENAHLEDAQFRNAHLEGANLRGANLDRAVIKDSEFYNTDLSNAILHNAYLYNVGLIRARIDGANFADARLIEVDLKSAVFDENTDFSEVDVDPITINNLRGSNWDKTGKWGQDTLEKIEKKYGRRDRLGIDEIEQAIKYKQSLKGKDLTILSDKDEAKKLKTLNFTNIDLEDANLKGAYLQGAKFVRSKLRGAIFDGAHLEDTQFRNAKSWSAKFRDAHLDRAVIKDSEFYNADFSKATLHNAYLYNVGLIRARIDGADFKGARLIEVDLKSVFFDENTDFSKADVDSITIHNLRGSNWEKTGKWGQDTLKEIKQKYGRHP